MPKFLLELLPGCRDGDGNNWLGLTIIFEREGQRPDTEYFESPWVNRRMETAGTLKMSVEEVCQPMSWFLVIFPRVYIPNLTQEPEFVCIYRIETSCITSDLIDEFLAGKVCC